MCSKFTKKQCFLQKIKQEKEINPTMLPVQFTSYFSLSLPRRAEVQSLPINPRVWANRLHIQVRTQRDHIRIRPQAGLTGWAVTWIHISSDSPREQLLRYRIRRHEATGVSGRKTSRISSQQWNHSKRQHPVIKYSIVLPEWKSCVLNTEGEPSSPTGPDKLCLRAGFAFRCPF